MSFKVPFQHKLFYDYVNLCFICSCVRTSELRLGTLVCFVMTPKDKGEVSSTVVSLPLVYSPGGVLFLGIKERVARISVRASECVWVWGTAEFEPPPAWEQPRCSKSWWSTLFIPPEQS